MAATNRQQLIIFARPPVAGQCKTRLIPLLGKQGAADFYGKLLRHCLDSLQGLINTDIALYIQADLEHPFIQQLGREYAVDLYLQQGNNLGERMHHALQQGLRRYTACVLIGTDCPAISGQYIQRAFDALQHAELCLGPAEDGGYVLIAARRVEAALFHNIHWGSARVLQQSLHNVRRLAYNVGLLNALRDIDTPDDFLFYQSRKFHLTQEFSVQHHQADKIRNNVRQSYGRVAEASNRGDCCGEASSCCGVSDDEQINQLISSRLGYSEADMNNVPAGADMGLGCGNPKAIAALQAGETVVDLGSGGGFDAFLAANEVGPNGHVIGIDMTPEMISRARNNARKGAYDNVEFRLGEIEHLPVADNTADVIISNCVINLSPHKQQVFNDALRILKPGGRLAISDVVSSTELPDEIKNDTQLYSACVSGASSVDELRQLLANAGFTQIEIEPKDESRKFIKDWAPGSNIEDYVVSAYIRAVNPNVS